MSDTTDTTDTTGPTTGTTAPTTATGPDAWRDYPPMAETAGRVEPAPRRVRGYLGGRKVFDTVAARYVWESVRYPQYYVPLSDDAAGGRGPPPAAAPRHGPPARPARRWHGEAGRRPGPPASSGTPSTRGTRR